MEQKKCSKCKEWKDLDCFSKDKSKKDGLYSQCKECRRKDWKETYKKNEPKRLDREKNIENILLYVKKKQCSKCKEWKSLDCFNKDKSRKDCLQLWCKQCLKDYRYNHKEDISIYRDIHKEDIKYQRKEYYKIKYKDHINSLLKFNSKLKLRQEIELYEEEVRESKEGYLQCKCAYCGDWFEPTILSINNRLSAINNGIGESRFYCSDPCKYACPTYGQILYPKGFKPATSREVQPELRQMVLARDNYTCKRCGKVKDELIEQGIALHCHHLEGIHWEPLMSADIDMCITYCQPCHVKAHQTPDCSYHDQQCK